MQPIAQAETTTLDLCTQVAITCIQSITYSDLSIARSRSFRYYLEVVSTKKGFAMRLSRSLAILAVGLFTLCSIGFADTFTFGTDPGGADPSPDTELQETFTAGATTLIAYGFSDNGLGNATALFFKNGSGDENGLGLANGGSDHEIGGKGFIQFTGTGIGSITVGSVQSGETWVLYGSSTLGDRGTSLKTGTTDGVVTLPGSWTYYSLAAGQSGDVLLDSATTAVPEPGTTSLLMTMGLVGLFAFGRRKLGKLSA
jgi:PEP-CTERM motif